LEHGKRHRKPVVRKDTDMTQTTEHKKITPGDEEFWSERGIDFHVRLARPYVRYYPDDPTPVQDAYATLRTVGQKATMSRHARQAAGILINRHAALPGLDPVPAEMRPDTAIRTGRMTRHWHGYGDPPEDGKHYERLDPDCPAGISHRWKHHGGENTEEVHAHEDKAKYIFLPKPTEKTKPREHDHDVAYRLPKNPPKRGKYSNTMEADERRRYHVAKYHGGVDVPGPHTHEWTKPDTSEDLARRLDVHPFAAPLFDEAETVYFVIEGCLKADSALSAILREARLEAVFSVPSVSLWLAEELEEFVERKLRGKRVIVVPDGDWAKKREVIEQARLCCLYLLRRDIEAYVAAPPVNPDGTVDHKGLDDFLGAGFSLDDLMVQSRRVDAYGQRAWLSRFRRRKDAVARAADALYGLAYAAEDGKFTGSLQRFAKTLDIPPRRAGRAIHQLEELGAITISGDLAVRRDWFSKSLQWEEPPVITLIPELRGDAGEEYCLRELLERG
jgi:hypothetical protein